MARKPNYRFERQERDRKKAVKKEEKQKARDARKTETSGADPAQSESAPTEAPPPSED